MSGAWATEKPSPICGVGHAVLVEHDDVVGEVAGDEVRSRKLMRQSSLTSNCGHAVDGEFGLERRLAGAKRGRPLESGTSDCSKGADRLAHRQVVAAVLQAVGAELDCCSAFSTGTPASRSSLFDRAVVVPVEVDGRGEREGADDEQVVVVVAFEPQFGLVRVDAELVVAGAALGDHRGRRCPATASRGWWRRGRGTRPAAQQVALGLVAVARRRSGRSGRCRRRRHRRAS